MTIESVNTPSPVQEQRLKQILRLNTTFELSQTHEERCVTIRNSEGEFSFHVDNHQRAVFYNMLRGRLLSAPEEGLGNVNFSLVEGRLRIL